MSIFCSMKGIGDEWDSKPSHRPLRYRGSHIFPSAKDEHGGSVDLAYIARHITRDRKDNRSEKSPLHPWLRFGVSVDNQSSGETVVLSRKQVADLVEQLKWFLRESEAKKK